MTAGVFKMTGKIKRSIVVLSAVFVLAVLTAFPVITLADANISMTTTTSIAEISEDIEISVQITSDEQIGTYFIEMEYDSTRMRYVRGADSEQDGIITLTGTGLSSTVSYDLRFTGAIGGEAGIIVRNALVNNTSGNPVNTTDSGMLTITVVGQADNSASFTQKLAEEDELFGSGLPISGTIHDAAGNTLYVIDLTRTTPDIMFFPFELQEEMFEGQKLTFAVNKDHVIKMLPLTDADDNMYLYAVNGEMFYPMTDYTDTKGTRYAYVSLEACPTMPQKIASDTEMWDYTVYAIGRDGQGGFYLINSNGELELYTVLNATTLAGAGLFSKVFSGEPIPWESYLIIAAIVIVIIIILVIILSVLHKGLKKRKIRKVAEYEYDYSIDAPVSVDEDIDDIDVIRKSADVEEDLEKAPVSRRVKTEPDPAGRKSVVRVDDLDSAKPEKKDDKAEQKADEVAEEPEVEVEGPETDGKDELLSLDDIVLTEEDVPGGPENVYRIPDASKVSEADTSPEPEKAEDEVAKTIRLDKIEEKLKEDTEPIGETQAIEIMLEKIDI